MEKKNYLFLCLCLFVDYQQKNKKKNKEFEHSKLKFHITRNSSLESSSIIEEKKEHYAQVLYLQRTRAW